MKSSDRDAWIYERGQQSYKCNWTFELVVAMACQAACFMHPTWLHSGLHAYLPSMRLVSLGQLF